MDFVSAISALSSINGAKDALKAALAVRDFNAAASAVAQITDELIKAQQGLLSQNAFVAQLQAELEQHRRELAEMKKALEDRGRYALVELSQGVFVYRLQQREHGQEIAPGPVEAVHHVCQSCFDKGIKSVLQRHVEWSVVYLRCPTCTEKFDTGDRVPSRSVF